MSFNQKYQTILDIVNHYTPILPIIIHQQYPRQKVIEHLEHAIIPYLKSQYSLNQSIKDTSKFKVITILKSLHNTFGRVEFDTKSCTYLPIDRPKFFIDPSFSSFSFNSNNSNEIFVFGTNNIDIQDDSDMDIDDTDDTDEIDDIDDSNIQNDNNQMNNAINIPDNDVITTNIILNSLQLNSNNQNPILSSPVFNPIVTARHINNINDISLTNTMTEQDIINSRIRLRQMLAGDY